jgi:hypothetical protein
MPDCTSLAADGSSVSGLLGCKSNREAAALIADYLKSVSKEAFLNDRLRQDAVIRRIQVVDRRDGKSR